jgi:hypothetical protein
VHNPVEICAASLRRPRAALPSAIAASFLSSAGAPGKSVGAGLCATQTLR